MLLDPLGTKRPTPKAGIPASLYVSGSYLTEGTLDQMNRLFEQECAAHTAPVEIRVVAGNTERVVRRRSPQR